MHHHVVSSLARRVLVSRGGGDAGLSSASLERVIPEAELKSLLGEFVGAYAGAERQHAYCSVAGRVGVGGDDLFLG